MSLICAKCGKERNTDGKTETKGNRKSKQKMKQDSKHRGINTGERERREEEEMQT